MRGSKSCSHSGKMLLLRAQKRNKHIMAEEKMHNGANQDDEMRTAAPHNTDDTTSTSSGSEENMADEESAETECAEDASESGMAEEEPTEDEEPEGNGEQGEADAALPLHPAPSLSRTTNIPPLMPAGFTRRPVAPQDGGKGKKAQRASAAKKGKAPQAQEAHIETHIETHIGTLRSQSAEPRTAGERPRQRRMKVHSDGGSRFFRRHWWWIVLLALLAVIGASLPWTLPVMREWEGTDAADTLSADTPKVAPRPAVAEPDTTGAAALADSLRQDSIRRAAAHAYWVRQQQLKAQAEAEAEAEAEGDASQSAPAAHADSVH